MATCGGRLARTSRFIAVTTFGTADDAQRAVDGVRRSTTGSPAPCPTGRRTPPPSPTRSGGHAAEGQLPHRPPGLRQAPADQAERDHYVAQAAEVARRLGVPDPPTTEAGLAETLAVFRSAAGDRPRPGRSVLPARRPPLPVALRPAYGVLMVAAIG